MRYLILFLSMIIFISGCNPEPIGDDTSKPMLARSLANPYYAGQPAPLATVQPMAKLIATVTADANEPGISTKSWQDSIADFVPIPASWNGVCLSFYGYGDGTGDGNPNDATFSYDVYLIDYISGVMTVATGNTGTIGAQQLSHIPYDGTLIGSATDPNSSYCWADDLNEGTVRYGLNGSGSVIKYLTYYDNQSTDGKAEVCFDRKQAYGIWVRIYNMSDQLVTSVSCVANGY